MRLIRLLATLEQKIFTLHMNKNLGSAEKEYIVEGLTPFTTYDLRFAAKNRVGLSPFGATEQLTTQNR